MYHLRTMGCVELLGTDGRRLPTMQRRPKDLALLVYLAASRPVGFHRRDTLLALFWPELDEQHARNALSQSLHRLRLALGADAVLIEGRNDVAAAPERVECDALLFDRRLQEGNLAGAMALDGGEFLSGFHAPRTAAEFDDWVATERERLRRAAFNALLALIDAAQADRDDRRAVDWLRKAAALRPLDETIHRRLIDALSATGDRAAALDVYERLSIRLCQQCGYSASRETQAAADAARTRPPAAAVPPRARVAQSDPAVAELFLRGRYFSATLSQTARGLEYLDRALRLDPRYAPAHAGRAMAVANLALLGQLPPQRARMAVSASANRAIRLDDATSEAHTALALGAMMFDWNWEASEREFRLAITLNPDSGDAHAHFAVLLAAVSRHREAVAHARRSQRLDPLGPWANFILGWTLYRARRHAESLDRLQALVELSPHFALGHLFLAENYLQNGSREAAIEACGTALSQLPRNQLLLGIGACVLALAGDGEGARALLGTLVRGATREYVSPGFLAAAYAGLGERDAAFRHWNAMCRERSAIAFLVPADPLYDCIRDDPRFGALARQVGLRPDKDVAAASAAD